MFKVWCCVTVSANVKDIKGHDDVYTWSVASNLISLCIIIFIHVNFYCSHNLLEGIYTPKENYQNYN